MKLCGLIAKSKSLAGGASSLDNACTNSRRNIVIKLCEGHKIVQYRQFYVIIGSSLLLGAGSSGVYSPRM